MLEFQTPQLFPILQSFFWFLNCSKKQKTGGQGVVSSVSPLGPRKVQIFSQFGWRTVLFYFSNSKKEGYGNDGPASGFLSLFCIFCRRVEKSRYFRRAGLYFRRLEGSQRHYCRFPPSVCVGVTFFQTEKACPLKPYTF